MTNGIEEQLTRLIAVDRLYVPTSSMDGKLKRQREKLAKALVASGLDERFEGERAYAFVETEETSKARGLKEGIAAFKEAYPRHGQVLQGMIEEKRAERETSLYFGLLADSHLTSQDYLNVMTSLGFTEHAARRVYPELMDASRKLARQRDNAERSILVG